MDDGGDTEYTLFFNYSTCIRSLRTISLPRTIGICISMSILWWSRESIVLKSSRDGVSAHLYAAVGRTRKVRQHQSERYFSEPHTGITKKTRDCTLRKTVRQAAVDRKAMNGIRWFSFLKIDQMGFWLDGVLIGWVLRYLWYHTMTTVGEEQKGGFRSQSVAVILITKV